MRAKLMTGCIAVAVLLSTQVASAQSTAPAGAALGSPGFAPSADRPMGWRGDGTGRFPGATPPVKWGRVATSLKALRSQAAKPGEGQTGQSIADGVIREWLVLGPVEASKEQDFVKTQAENVEVLPTEGDKAGELAWKKVATDESCLDFFALYGKGTPKDDVAFAHAYLYSAEKAKFRMTKEIDLVMGGHDVKTWVNGVALKDSDFTLQKGWNSILMRVPCGPRLVNDRIMKEYKMPAFAAGIVSWYVQPIIYGAPGSECASENILWTTRLPGWSIASPVIAGDRIFALGERRTLCCLDKSTGKILWAHTATLCDVATDDDRKAQPELFKELEPLVARLAEVDKAMAAADADMPKLINEKVGLETKIDDLMYKVDNDKYNTKRIGPAEPGYAPRTPVTDGKFIYASFHPCLNVCYDVAGNRKWVHHRTMPPGGETHGFISSPCLSGGKFVVDTEKVVAVDAQTGKQAWEAPHQAGTSLLAGAIGGEPVIFLGGASGFGSVKGQGTGVVRAKDGQVIAKPGWNTPTPIIQGDAIYCLRTFGGGEAGTGKQVLDIFSIGQDKVTNAGTIAIDTLKDFRVSRLEINLASPLYHEGLIYIVDADGMLTVVDAEKQNVVYRKLLDIDNCPGGIARGASGASPTLGGKYIYIFGNMGTCVLIEPGRQFKQVAKNRIEYYIIGTEAEYPWQNIYSTRMEQTVGCPVFDGKRMYYRGLANLYCIESKN